MITVASERGLVGDLSAIVQLFILINRASESDVLLSGVETTLSVR